MRLFSIAFLALALSCGDKDSADSAPANTDDTEQLSPGDGSSDDTDQQQGDDTGGPPPGDDTGQHQGPPECETEADCEGACPEGAIGCTCFEDPVQMIKICVPTCKTDDDCSALDTPDELVCEEKFGICIPEGPPP